MADDQYNSLTERVGVITGHAPEAHQGATADMAQHAYTDGGTDPRTAAEPRSAGGLRTHTIHSQQFNVPMAQLDFPARWNVRALANGSWEGGASGLTVKPMGGQNFMHVTGQAAQYYQAAGVNLRAPVSPEQLVKQDLAAHMRKDGFELIGHGEAPAIAQADQKGFDGLYSSAPTRKTCRAVVSDWRKGNERATVVMHWFAFEGGDMVSWGYQLTGIQGPATRFEQEKQDLLKSLASLRHNPAYFAAYALSEQQKEQQSWGAHNARMRSNQAAFDAQQRAFRESSDATNAAIMGSYNSRMESQDRGQAAWVDMMREEQNAVNPYSGEQFKVESGSNKYWMNQHGEYYGTDDILTDPNVGNTSNYQWREVDVEP
jgi:hypothetical protein